MDMRECEHSHKMRARLEPLLLTESAPRLTDAGIAELRTHQHIEQTHDVEQFRVLDRQLHWTTYRHHRAEELVTIVARLRETRHHYRRTFTRLMGHQRSWCIRAEYRLLIDVEQEA